MAVRKALVVGIDDYPGNSLNGCCNDSAALKSLLERNGNGHPNFDVRQVNNVKSKAELRACIERCFSGNADVALFYYSGHGHIDAIGGYLVTPDCSAGDPGVSLADVLTIANNSKCGERIIILDSCHSGFMGSVDTAGQDTATIRQGVTILTASRSTEPSMEIDGHGVFTSLLIEALKGGRCRHHWQNHRRRHLFICRQSPRPLGPAPYFQDQCRKVHLYPRCQSPGWYRDDSETV